MQNEQTKMGQTVYETICQMFDDKGFHYQRHDDQHYVTCTLRGEDIPMDIIFDVRDERQLVKLVSFMPFKVPEDKKMDVILAITAVNNWLIDGAFVFDIEKGIITFTLTSSYIESILGKELFEYMLMVSASTIDDYNDKFMMIAKGMMSFEQFLQGEE